MVTYYTSNIDNNLIFLIILEPRNTSHIWYLNTLANILKLTFEMTTKFSQKVKIAKQNYKISGKWSDNLFSRLHNQTRDTRDMWQTNLPTQ